MKADLASIQQEIRAKKTNENSHIYVRSLDKSLAACLQRVAEVQGVSAEAAGILIANALEYSLIEDKIEELLHGTHENRDDLSEYELNKMRVGYEEVKEKKNSENIELMPIVPIDVIKKITNQIAKNERLSYDAASMVFANVIMFSHVWETIEQYSHFFMTGQQTSPQ